MGAIIWAAAWAGSRLITPRLIASGVSMTGRAFGTEMAAGVSGVLNNWIVNNVIGGEVQHALRHLMRGGQVLMKGDTAEAQNEVALVFHTNSDEVKEDLKKANEFISNDASPSSLEESAVYLAERIREKVPVRTGNLRGSVGWEKYWKTGEIRVGYGIKYRVYTAHLVELGTKAHIISPSAKRGKKALANKRAGIIYGRKVRHPGQRGQHIMRDVLAGESYRAVDTYKVKLNQKISDKYGS